MAEARGTDRWEGIRRRKNEMLSVRREMARRSSGMAKAVEWVGNALVRPWFFVSFLMAHVAWVVLNLGAVPGVAPWDPPPFMLLATIASVEAPFIALLVLMAQSRARRINELREEVSLQVDLYMEHQTTAVLQMLDAIQDELGMERKGDEEFEMLSEPLDPRALMEQVEHELTQEEEGARPPEE